MLNNINMSFITKKLEEFDELAPEYGKWRIDRNIAKSFLSTALGEMIKEVDTNISRLLQKVADSPLDKRLNGWDALLEVRKSLSSLREDNK